jgi:MinD-like ATPase involved in chromosome partitioning or flagellar assembly
VVDNLEIRVRYLNKDITDKQFASKVHAAYKAHEKKKDIADVIQLQVQGVTDIIYRIAHSLKQLCTPGQPDTFKKMTDTTAKQVITMFSEVYQLTDYSNGILKEHAQTYGCKTWKLAYDPNSWRVLK